MCLTTSQGLSTKFQASKLHFLIQNSRMCMDNCNKTATKSGNYLEIGNTGAIASKFHMIIADATPEKVVTILGTDLSGFSLTSLQVPHSYDRPQISFSNLNGQTVLLTVTGTVRKSFQFAYDINGCYCTFNGSNKRYNLIQRNIM